MKPIGSGKGRWCTTKKAALAAVVGAAALSCGPAKTPCPPPANVASGSAPRRGDPKLEALFEEEWQYKMRDDPEYASHLGDRRYGGAWRDESPAAYERRRAHAEEVLATLSRIDREGLSAIDRENYDIFRMQQERVQGSLRLGLHYFVLDQREGIQTASQLADALTFETAEDYRDWIARLSSFPAHAEQTTALLREASSRRLVHPRVVMDRIPAQLDRQLVDDPEKSPFFEPFLKMPASLPREVAEKLRADGRRAIADHVVPALRKFKAFFVSEYLPKTPREVGAWQWPNGAEMYRFLAQRHTTTDLPVDQIHETGLREVRRLRDEMAAIIKKVGYKGDLAAFFTHLRQDPQFYYRTPDELFEGYAAISKRIEPRLVRVFRTLPRMPFGLEAIPDNIAPDTTTAYYREPAADGSRAGTYFVNLFKPESRPKWEMMALSLHEAVPGHHLQIALAMEQESIPNFRRYGSFTAFIEGWALYAESLGEEMGLYDEPYAKFGQLTYDMWRSVRLVVDTGMHAKKWDRDRAIAFFRENAPKTELDITNEIDRYIVMPGQALAYKIGQLKFLELRRRGETKLGARFDLRRFHDASLLRGAVPLFILERNIDAWIAAEAAGRVPPWPQASHRL